MRIVTVSPRLPAGLLSAPAWEALRTGPAFAIGADAESVRAAGIPVTDAVAADVPPDAVVIVSVDDGPTLAALSDATVVAGSWDPPGGRLLEAVEVMDRLRSPGACPWVGEQTHESLRPYLIEESYEVIDAITEGDPAGLREELGDILLQVLFHSRIAAEGEGFTIDDVAAGIAAKLIRRHPHVFADVTVHDADEVHRNWERIKRTEKQRASSLDGVPRALPALTLAQTLQGKAERAGLGTVEAVTTEPFGRELFALVARARRAGVDAEQALRDTATAYDAAVRAAESAGRPA